MECLDTINDEGMDNVSNETDSGGSDNDTETESENSPRKPQGNAPDAHDPEAKETQAEYKTLETRLHLLLHNNEIIHEPHSDVFTACPGTGVGRLQQQLLG